MEFFCDNPSFFSVSPIFFCGINWNEVMNMFFGNLSGCSDRSNTWWVVIIAIIVLYFLFFDKAGDGDCCRDSCADPCRDRCC